MDFSQIEREWFQKKVAGATPTTPLLQLKRMYFVSQVGSTSPVEKLESLERRFLKKVITDNGGSYESRYVSDYLKMALATLNLPVSINSLQQNWLTFYLNN